MQNLIRLTIATFIAQMTDNFETIEHTPEGAIIKTMNEDHSIIKDLYTCSAQHDIDILEYTLHSKIEEDEDGNFITTMDIKILNITN